MFEPGPAISSYMALRLSLVPRSWFPHLGMEGLNIMTFKLLVAIPYSLSDMVFLSDKIEGFCSLMTKSSV